MSEESFGQQDGSWESDMARGLKVERWDVTWETVGSLGKKGTVQLSMSMEVVDSGGRRSGVVLKERLCGERVYCAVLGERLITSHSRPQLHGRSIELLLLIYTILYLQILH